MATEIVVPALGESVTTATVARWIKQQGETVAADEPLVELCERRLPRLGLRKTPDVNCDA